MAFCNACGAQLGAGDRFCVKCGTQVGANGAATSAPMVAPVATAVATPVAAAVAAPPVQPQLVSAVPPTFPPGPVPVMMPPPPAARKGGLFWVIVLIALAAGGWWYYKHHSSATASAPSQPGTGPSQQGPQAGAPSGSAPGTAEPGAPVQPGDPGPSETNANLVAQQGFGGDWRTYGGYIQVYNVRWQNRSTVPLSSAVLECDQYAVTSEVLSQIRTKLNGPVLPGGTATYNPFLMGAVQPYLKTVNCAIVSVTPTS